MFIAGKIMFIKSAIQHKYLITWIYYASNSLSMRLYNYIVWHIDFIPKRKLTYEGECHCFRL